jgi:hypothetical protein
MFRTASRYFSLGTLRHRGGMRDFAISGTRKRSLPDGLHEFVVGLPAQAGANCPTGGLDGAQACLMGMPLGSWLWSRGIPWQQQVNSG